MGVAKPVPAGGGPAPYQSCLACFKGDVSTIFSIEGEFEFSAVFLEKQLGIEPKEAVATLREILGDMGHKLAPGAVPAGILLIHFRLCQECADKAGIRVAGEGHTVLYRQPKEMMLPQNRMTDRFGLGKEATDPDEDD
jgi:hypothetical protein